MCMSESERTQLIPRVTDVDAAPLLHELGSRSKENSSSRMQAIACKEKLPRAFSCFVFVLQAFEDSVKHGLNFRVIDWLANEAGHHGKGFTLPTLLSQPSWRLSEEWKHCCRDDRVEALERERKPPRNGLSRDISQSKIHPLRRAEPGDIRRKGACNQSSSVFWLARLRQPYRDRACH